MSSAEPTPAICGLLSAYLAALPTTLFDANICRCFWEWCVKPSTEREDQTAEIEEQEEVSSKRKRALFFKGKNKDKGKEKEMDVPADDTRQVRITQILLRLLPPPQLSLFAYLCSFFTQLGGGAAGARGMMMWILTRWVRISDGLISNVQPDERTRKTGGLDYGLPVTPTLPSTGRREYQAPNEHIADRGRDLQPSPRARGVTLVDPGFASSDIRASSPPHRSAGISDIVEDEPFLLDAPGANNRDRILLPSDGLFETEIDSLKKAIGANTDSDAETASVYSESTSTCSIRVTEEAPLSLLVRRMSTPGGTLLTEAEAHIVDLEKMVAEADTAKSHAEQEVRWLATRLASLEGAGCGNCGGAKDASGNASLALRARSALRQVDDVRKMLGRGAA
ncbi:hypothetical protein PLICRDRAFT_95895 [Plicaturopsis crispa FD-325 SS-3]|uniref:Rho-GAP domain-containing protein n=1 Tax=Plicaturopsis crispa FD-325 SS-3 TaxID=944288 RepID=A0A0C9T5R3_PLICR|nr:hypothetical protein PLICRDRAFT_95895 [Plicaturopsis crispa FD-325 SS-3]